MNYLTPGTQEWKNFLQELEFSRMKQNKDLLCTACWKIYNFQEARTHKLKFPSHKSQILTSKYFSSEQLFIEVARKNGKFVHDDISQSVKYLSPFADSNKNNKFKHLLMKKKFVSV